MLAQDRQDGQKRVALVIGNSGYKSVSALQNPANDSADIALALEALSFEVERASDLTFDEMRQSLRAFSKKAANSDVALVFYAGHGIEVDGQNYLIPVDAQLERADDVDFEALPLNLVMGALNGARKLKLVLLDACRNNPFLAGMKTAGGQRAIGRGLARVEPAVGTLVGFAAKEGTTASDGEGRNSPYTKALLEHLNKPGLEINLLFRKVRDSVLAQTRGQQEPFTYGSLPGQQLYLTAFKQPTKQSAAVAAPSSVKLSEAGQVWIATQATSSVAVLLAFEKNYSGTPYAALAKARIAELRAAKVKSETTNSPPQAANPLVSTLEPETKKAAEVGKRLAEVDPNTQQSIAKPPRFASEAALVRAIQKALNKHGCDAGKVDGKWGKKGIGAAKRFSRYANLGISADPSENLLDIIDGRSGKVCPLVCNVRFHVKNNRCVLKTCRKGEKLNRQGKCRKFEDTKKTVRKKRTLAAGKWYFKKPNLPCPTGHHLGFCDGSDFAWRCVPTSKPKESCE